MFQPSYPTSIKNRKMRKDIHSQAVDDGLAEAWADIQSDSEDCQDNITPQTSTETPTPEESDSSTPEAEAEAQPLDESDFGLGQLDRFCRPWRYHGAMTRAVRPELQMPQNPRRLKVIQQLHDAIKSSKYGSLNNLRKEMQNICSEFLNGSFANPCTLAGDHLLNDALECVSAIIYDQVCAGENAPPPDQPRQSNIPSPVTIMQLKLG